MAVTSEEIFADSSIWTIVGISLACLAVIILTLLGCGSKKKSDKKEPEPVPEVVVEPKESEPEEPKAPPIDDVIPDPSLKSIYNFAVDFYRAACANQRDAKPGSDNETLYSTKVISPLAVQSALYLCYLGAGGSTKQEIRRAIYPEITADEKEAEKIIREVATDIDGASAETAEVIPFNGLSYAMRVYAPSNTYRYSSEFHDIVSTRGGRLCDFFEYRFDAGGDRTPLPLATFARSINRFIVAASENEVKDLIDEVVLTNALCPPSTPPAPARQQRHAGLVVFAQIRIKCNWAIAFETKQTWPMDFVVPGGYKMPMESMSTRSQTFGYYEDTHCQTVRIPLGDPDTHANLYILLPRKHGDILAFEAHLTGDRLWRMMRNCGDTDVKVIVPKMFVDSKLSPMRTMEALQSLGMRNAFDPYQADFTPMLEGKARLPLHVAAVMHNAVFEAYEEAGFSQASCERPEKLGKARRTIKADHPFVFVVAGGRHYQIPLMIGRFGGRPFYKALQENAKSRAGR